MKVVIRTDSSYDIGTGHMMRCLTLAERLRAHGADVAFVSRALPGNIADAVTNRGFRQHLLPYDRQADMNSIADNLYARWLAVEIGLDANQTTRILNNAEYGADWVVVDHYGLDERWEETIRPSCGNILVIDDLANRKHECHILLDQNLYKDPTVRYAGLTPDSCTYLIGPKHALLRDEFIQARQDSKIRTQLERILIFYGGSDATNETVKAITAIKKLDTKDIVADVIIGPANQHAEEVHRACDTDSRFTVHTNVANMSELMLRADLALGAGGTTTWERCCLGLPTIITAIAENQHEIGHEVAAAGAARYLGRAGEAGEEALSQAISQLAGNPTDLQAMSRRTIELVDGCGSERVVDSMLKHSREGAQT